MCIVQSNRLAHTHSDVNNNIPTEIRTRVGIMRQQRIPPKKQCVVIQAEYGKDAVNMAQVYNLVRAEDALTKSSFTTVGEVADWYNAPKNTPTSFGSSGEEFQYVVSTPRLLKMALQFRIVCCDATYKLNIHNYPVTLFGGIDAGQKLHILAYSLTTHENGANYRFVFESVNNKILELYSKVQRIQRSYT